MFTVEHDRRTVLKMLGGAGAVWLSRCAFGTGTEASVNAKNAAKPGPAGLREELSRHVGPGDVPGLVALVGRRGHVEVEVMGTMAADRPEPMARDAIFRITSMTKPITAVAALILVEEGKLKLDGPVDHLLPELANRRVLRRLAAPLDDTVPASRPIRVRDLLTFTMGMGIVFAAPGTYPIQVAMEQQRLGQGPPTPQVPPPPNEWMRRLGTLPLIHQPGERWMYNTGADVLGVLIARASGQSFPDFLRERVFEPLGMRDTAFVVPKEKLHRLVPCYGLISNHRPDPVAGAFGVVDAPDGQWSRPPAFPSGAAGLVSTIDDYYAFSEMMLERGLGPRARILSAASVDEMTRDQLTAEQKARSRDMPGFFDSHGWGFGMAVVTGPDDSGSVGAYGWDGGYGTCWRSDPKEQRVTILMTQRAWTSAAPPPVAHAFWQASQGRR